MAFAQDCFPSKPANAEGAVLEYGKSVLSNSEERRLEEKISTIWDSSGVQIVVVITDDLCGMDAASYSTEIGDRWGVGQDGDDNGAVILVKPKHRSTDRGEVWIATGRGLEIYVTDAMAGRIRDYEMIPEFREGDYAGGIEKAVHSIALLAAGEYDKFEGGDLPLWVLVIVLLLIILLIIFISSKAESMTTYSGGGWTNHRGGGWYTGGWTGGSRGGGFGGGGGGGFGGFGGGSFGGGSFGGGGAGGSW